MAVNTAPPLSPPGTDRCLAQLADALPAALARGELCLHFQPQVSLHDGAIAGAEALLRWTSPDWGPVAPDLFIAAAERHGQIGPLGLWVIEQACRQVVAWQAEGMHPPRVAVNLSALQLLDAQLLPQIEAVLHATGAEPQQLGIEVTESASMANPAAAARTLGALRAMGFEISLDDFGTGHSSLSCLRTLPVEMVKIDRSFIADMDRAPESAAVTRSIISMAHALRLRVLAEGVETEPQLTALLRQGCDLIQGYWFSRPLPAANFAALMRSGHVLPTTCTHRRGRQRGLLLVDDEPHVRSALSRLFRREGYRLVTAESGAEGLQRLAEHEIDVIISDQRMPGMTGVEFLRQAKALYPDTVRMTLSGYTDLQSIIDAVNEGAVYKFLTKPWDDELLRGHVAEAFRHKEMADDNRRLQAQVADANRAMAEVNARLSAMLREQVHQTDLQTHSADGLRGLLDALPLAIVGLDPEDMVVQVNALAARHFPPGDLVLGDPAGASVRAVRERLRPLPEGHGLHLPALQCRAWRQVLQHDDGSPRGELLILVSDHNPPEAGPSAALPDHVRP